MRAALSRLLYRLADSLGDVDSRAKSETNRRAMQALMKMAGDSRELVEEADKEARRRDALGLGDEVPKQWQSYYYLRQGYRATLAKDNSQDHWRGGPPQHEDAICPICRKPLLLFWDINCRDSRFRAESPDIFGELDRLPLYYCCRRPEPTVYQVLPNSRIRMIKPELCGWEESPFHDFPDEFDRKPIRLEIIPREVENLLIIVNEFALDWLNEAELDRLSEYLQENFIARCSINLSQFGGVPLMTQGHREIECPNADCLTHQMGHPILRNKQHYQMKEIAVIDDDSGFEMETGCAQIAFHICWKCHTVHAEYRCD